MASGTKLIILCLIVGRLQAELCSQNIYISGLPSNVELKNGVYRRRPGEQVYESIGDDGVSLTQMYSSLNYSISVEGGSNCMLKFESQKRGLRFSYKHVCSRESTEENIFSLQCVRRGVNFKICNSGELELLTSAVNTREKAGKYILQPKLNEERPVYKHETKEFHLYFHSVYWNVGPVLGGNMMNMWSHDSSRRPELINEHWMYLHFTNEPSHYSDTHAHLVCSGFSATGDVSGDDCSRANCSGRGECLDTGHSFVCYCEENYFGKHCERELTCCGAPSSRKSYSLKSSTGEGFLDTASYVCADNLSERKAVCGADGNWQGADDSDCQEASLYSAQSGVMPP